MTRWLSIAARDDDGPLEPGVEIREARVSELEEKGFQVDLLHGVSAIRQSVESQLWSFQDTSMVAGLGHGEESTFLGNDGSPIFSAATPGSLTQLKGKVVHLTSCSTAQLLGPALVAAGARAFIGYADEVVFPLDKGGVGPAAFYNCDFEIAKALARGDTAAEAVDAGRRALVSEASKIESQNLSLAGLIAQSLLLAAEDLRGPSAGDGGGFGDPTSKLD